MSIIQQKLELLTRERNLVPYQDQESEAAEQAADPN
jgi:hypothetical protein